MGAMDSLIHIVPNVMQPIIILFYFLPGLMRNSTFLYRVRGVEVSIGAMGYMYNGVQAQYVPILSLSDWLRLRAHMQSQT